MRLHRGIFCPFARLICRSACPSSLTCGQSFDFDPLLLREIFIYAIYILVSINFCNDILVSPLKKAELHAKMQKMM